LLKDRFDFIDRISVAIYEPKTDLLKTFVHSSDDENPLVLYSAKLADSASRGLCSPISHISGTRDIRLREPLRQSALVRWCERSGRTDASRVPN
jgi:hypothetical protein